jgi:signal transduction histidine kinase
VFKLSGNVTLIERPLRPVTLISSVQVALRARERQYRMRQLLQEQKRAEEFLRTANELLEHRVEERTAKLRETINDLETFSYSITHDMRAPLRAMQGFSKLLLENHSAKLNAEAVEYLTRISNSANRLDLLIRDVLSYSNIVRAELVLGPVDIDTLIRDIIRDYPSLHPEKADITVPQTLPAVLGNEAFLTQCFSNLLDNAVKFVEPGVRPRVEISAEVLDDLARFKVQDNGIGIPQEHRRGIFKLFHRAQHAYPGTGIGLAVVQKSVERMGGKVGLDSTPGAGSTFWVELRRAKA